MTAQELIAKLQECPSDTLVLVRGYEEGYDDIGLVLTLDVERTPRAWYLGQYDVPSEDSGEPTYQAIVLSCSGR